MTTPDDLLHHPDPRVAAEHAHLEALLRCWLRETDTAVSAGPLRVALPSSGLRLETEVRHYSAVDMHRFGA
ncbi:MAG: IucA/IucC family protein, partial [Stackebrandtia sp.]